MDKISHADEKRQNEIIRIQKKPNNFVMLDKGFLEDVRLSFKAKGILAYLLSKPDNWKVIVKDLINHSQDGKKAIYSGLRELKEFGYYKKVPVRDADNKVISHWESVIYECPLTPDEKELPKNDPQEKKVEKSPVLPLLTPFVHIQNEEIQNGQHNNIYPSNNNFNQELLSIYPRDSEPEVIDTIDTPEIEKPEITKEAIADKIGLSELLSEQPDKEAKITELYDIICDVLMTDPTAKIRVAKRQLPSIVVKQEFLKLTKPHILYVLDCLEKNGGNIRDNSKGYIITSLYNCLHSIHYFKDYSQSAFKDKAQDNSKSQYDKFFDNLTRKNL